MQAKDVNHKLTGWTLPYVMGGQLLYVTVHADDAAMAAAFFGLAGFDVQRIDGIVPTVTAMRCREIDEMHDASEIDDDTLLVATVPQNPDGGS